MTKVMLAWIERGQRMVRDFTMLDASMHLAEIAKDMDKAAALNVAIMERGPFMSRRGWEYDLQHPQRGIPFVGDMRENITGLSPLFAARGIALELPAFTVPADLFALATAQRDLAEVIRQALDQFNPGGPHRPEPLPVPAITIEG